jgi:hypothetical protein
VYLCVARVYDSKQMQGDSKFSIHGEVISKAPVHGENGLFIYRPFSVLAPWTSGLGNDLNSFFFRFRHLSTLLKNSFTLFVWRLLNRLVLFPYTAFSDCIYSGGILFSVMYDPNIYIYIYIYIYIL